MNKVVANLTNYHGLKIFDKSKYPLRVLPSKFYESFIVTRYFLPFNKLMEACFLVKNGIQKPLFVFFLNNVKFGISVPLFAILPKKAKIGIQMPIYTLFVELQK